MELPLGLIADAAREGNIYFFEDDCPVGVKGHMHVCLKVGERVLLFSTCTSQTNTVLNYVKFLGYDANTFPCFRQDEMQIGQVVNGVKLSTRVTEEVKALLR